MTLKQKIHSCCLAIINERIKAKRKTLADLHESAANETKSTAGDKHETALAMLQIEQENTSRQLQETLMQKDVFIKINPSITSAIVAFGSLVKTNRCYFYISIALGKITVDHKNIIALSPQSPLAKKMSGLKVGSSIEMNTMVYKIESIE